MFGKAILLYHLLVYTLFKWGGGWMHGRRDKGERERETDGLSSLVHSPVGDY